jgi:hypothetical protein
MFWHLCCCCFAILIRFVRFELTDLAHQLRILSVVHREATRNSRENHSDATKNRTTSSCFHSPAKLGRCRRPSPLRNRPSLKHLQRNLRATPQQHKGRTGVRKKSRKKYKQKQKNMTDPAMTPVCILSTGDKSKSTSHDSPETKAWGRLPVCWRRLQLKPYLWKTQTQSSSRSNAGMKCEKTT